VTPNPRKRKRGKGPVVRNQNPLFKGDHPLISYMTIGFNPTTEHLEAEIRNKHENRMKVVFVARGDTTSTHLYAHFPLMASILPHLILVSLGKGVESRLCNALELKKVGVLGLMVVSCLVLIMAGQRPGSRSAISTGRKEGAKNRGSMASTWQDKLCSNNCKMDPIHKGKSIEGETEE
jgi:hypothetical protein